jgi:hypothetical protein
MSEIELSAGLKTEDISEKGTADSLVSQEILTDIANSYNNLFDLYQSQSDYKKEEAESLYTKSLKIAENTLGKDDLITNKIRENLKFVRTEINISEFIDYVPTLDWEDRYMSDSF